jgi:hypothetical protein
MMLVSVFPTLPPYERVSSKTEQKVYEKDNCDDRHNDSENLVKRLWQTHVSNQPPDQPANQGSYRQCDESIKHNAS